MERVRRYVMNDCGGGRRLLKLAWVINFQKLATIPILGLFMIWYGNVTAAAWIYLAMQGSYGLVWVIKDLAFPDPRFQEAVTIGAGIASLITVLGWYWLLGWLMIAHGGRSTYPFSEYAWFSLCISMCIVGCTIMIAADAQKYFTLRIRRGLIRDGMYRFIRHPNYLGEMLIHTSFALMVWHWLVILVLTWIWSSLFAVNMVLQENSLSRYPEWADYKKQSWWLFPPLL
jgi:protein-S-isoprenylcysteine O-methyltransferase Ste14